MTWRDQLSDAEQAFERDDATGAFLKAFGALEMCYAIAAGERGWKQTTAGNDKYMEIAGFLRDGRHVTAEQFIAAQHLGWARNVVSHKFGFEPSLSEVKKTIQRVRQLCSRFGRSVADVMTKPVITARPDQPVGEFISHIIEGGISQFPVMEAGKIVGTFCDTHLVRAWEHGEGILDPATVIRDLMDQVILPSVDPNSGLDEARRRLQDTKAPALLILHNGIPQAIVTKYDLLRHLEI